MVKQEPWPRMLSTWIRPRWASAIHCGLWCWVSSNIPLYSSHGQTVTTGIFWRVVGCRLKRRQARGIYRAADNREHWLEVRGNVCDRFNWVVHVYCQMTNHYHVLVETVGGNLSLGMRQLNGRYTQRLNLE